MEKRISVEGNRVAGVSLHSIEWPPYGFYCNASAGSSEGHRGPSVTVLIRHWAVFPVST